MNFNLSCDFLSHSFDMSHDLLKNFFLVVEMGLRTCISEVMCFVSTVVSGVLCALVLMFPVVSDVLMRIMSLSDTSDGWRDSVVLSEWIVTSLFSLCSESETAAC